MCIEMKASIKMNTSLHQRYGVAVILRLRTTEAVAAGDMVLRMLMGLVTTRGLYKNVSTLVSAFSNLKILVLCFSHWMKV